MDDRARLRALLVERSVRVGDFTLASGDEIRITIDGIGTLINKVS